MYKWIDWLGDMLYPPRCPICDQVVQQGDGGICIECMKKTRYILPPRCMKCGKHMDDESVEYCRDCEKGEHYYIKGRALFAYKEIAKSVHRFKYKGRREYAKVYGKEMAYFLGETIKEWKADALIPVPLYKTRERRRGYNQAELLAKVLGKELKLPVYCDVVKRCKNTKPLKMLNPEERLNNLKRAFILVENGVKLKRVIIVDDIYTTGSTIDALTRILLEWGVEEVFFVTLAIGEDV